MAKQSLPNDGVFSKRCSKCKEAKSLESFHKNKNTYDGLQCECKACGLLYRSARLEQINQRSRIYRRENKDKTKAYWQKHYQENLEKERKRKAEYRKNNPEKIKLTGLQFRKNNPEKVKQHRMRWASKPENKEKIRTALQKCRKRNPAQYLAYTHNYRAKVKGNGGSYTAQEWIDLCNLYGNICLCCKQSLPLVVDHVIPITKNGTSNIDNLQPLCKSCNSKKHNKTVDYRPKLNPRIEIEIKEA